MMALGSPLRRALFIYSFDSAHFDLVVFCVTIITQFPEIKLKNTSCVNDFRSEDIKIHFLSIGLRVKKFTLARV